MMNARCSLLVCVLSLFLVNVAQADLVGWWAFDDANPANVGLDSSTYGNDLVAQGAAALDPAGNTGGALALGGGGDMLTYAGSFPTNVPTGASSYSMSAWIQPNASPGAWGILGWGNYGTSLQVNAFRTGTATQMQNYWWGADLVRATNPVVLDDGAWHHVAATYDGTTRTLYVDGASIGFDNPPVPNVQPVNFAVGRTRPATGEFFQGKLDDVAVWNEPLTNFAVQSLYAGTAPNVVDPNQAEPPPASLVGLWRFDDGGNLGVDSSVNANDLTGQNGAAHVAAADRVGAGAVSLDGVDDLLDLPGGPVANLPVGDDTYTMTAWIKPNSFGARGIVGWGDYEATRAVNAFRLGGANNINNYWWGADREATSPVNLSDGNWHHVGVTFDGTTRTLWVDGSPIDSDTPGTHLATTNNFAVGRTCASCGGGVGEFFDGQLDDVAVFAGSLDQPQMQRVMAGDFTAHGGPAAVLPQADLVSLWRFDDAGNIGLDSAPTGNDLTPQGGASQGPGGTLSLDPALSQMLDSPSAFPTDVPTGDQPYSIAAWVKPNNARDGLGIVGWGNYGAARQVNAVRIRGTNGIRHYWWSADLDAPDVSPVTLDGEWHHVTVTYDGVLRTIWIDGVPVIDNFPGANNAQPVNFAVGRTCNTCTTAEFFDGLLEDVAIFGGALDQTQIQTIMTGDFTEFGIPIPEPSTLTLTLLAAAVLLRRRRAV